MPSYYLAETEVFLNADDQQITDQLARSDAASGFSQLAHRQLEAWRESLAITRKALVDSGASESISGVVLEYRIPRREKRIDCVLVGPGDIVVIEFKVGSNQKSSEAIEQGVDYGLDLLNYHEASQQCRVHVIICPTEFSRIEDISMDNVRFDSIHLCGRTHLAEALASCFAESAGSMTADRWSSSRYKPIPGILEAANMLFAQSDLGAIEECLASSETIDRAIEFIQNHIAEAQDRSANKLLLVSGVPGSGKTLVGLKLAHSTEADTGFVYTSGNGPLLKVLRESLARAYARSHGEPLREARRYSESLLHSVHSFIEEGRRTNDAPAERVVIFDEAQRAWSTDKMQKMQKRQRRFNDSNGLPSPEGDVESEPQSLLSIMGRRPGSVIVALCGGGQEIHDGEAGIDEWLRAAENLEDWEVVSSPMVETALRSKLGPRFGSSQLLHLDVPLRSHRSSGHAEWVDAVLEGNCERARAKIDNRYFPIFLTRSLEDVRQHFEHVELGSRRFGIIASSSAGRLRPYGIEVSADFRKAIDYPLWFTGPREDFRSSFSLESAATEFEIQGLEMDWTVVAWSWDLLLSELGPRCQNLRGTSWSNVASKEKASFLINKYRVLLTRAREGIIIFLPRGSRFDQSRDVESMDQMEQYLLSCGAQKLEVQARPIDQAREAPAGT